MDFSHMHKTRRPNSMEGCSFKFETPEIQRKLGNLKRQARWAFAKGFCISQFRNEINIEEDSNTYDENCVLSHTGEIPESFAHYLQQIIENDLDEFGLDKPPAVSTILNWLRPFSYKRPRGRPRKKKTY